MGPALIVVLDVPAPAERVAFVLHDTFAMPFDEIGAILDRSPAAAKQLASRARRKIRRRNPPARPMPEVNEPSSTPSWQPPAAATSTHPSPCSHPTSWSEPTPPRSRWARHQSSMAAPVADAFTARAHATQPALIDGVAGAAFVDQGTPRAVFAFTIRGQAITAIDIVADPTLLQQLDIVALDH